MPERKWLLKKRVEARGLPEILKENLASKKIQGSVAAVDPRIAVIWLCNYRYFEQPDEDFVKQLLP